MKFNNKILQKNENEIKTFPANKNELEFIAIRTTRNVERSSSGCRKMTPEVNSDLHKVMKSNEWT